MPDTAPVSVLYEARAPGVLVLAEPGAARDRGRAAVEAAGLRVVALAAFGEAKEHLEANGAIDAYLLALDGLEDVEPLLARLIAQAESRRAGLVVSGSAAAIDLIAGAALGGDAEIVVDGDLVDHVAALHLAVRRTSARVGDIDAESGADRLRRLSDEVARIAQTLATLSSEEGRRRHPIQPEALGNERDEEPLAADQVRAIIRARRLRTTMFAPDLFSDPAWDMLLDLTAARLEGKMVAVSSLCIAAAVPPTTALRWIKTMTDAGLFLRSADPADGRRIFISLSGPAADAMEAYLGQARRILRDLG